jgi:hypothetical protein
LHNSLAKILKKNILNKAVCYLRFVGLFSVTGILFLSSCNLTKYVPEGETLLNENHVIVNDGINKSELLPYLKQKPNKKIFGTKFYLRLYNLSNINKQKWPHTWLRSIGEEPVIYDPNATIKTRDQFQSHLFSKGYFDGYVTDTVTTQNNKSDVYYRIEHLSPYTIRKLNYEIADSNIKQLFFFDSVNCLIERNKPYDVDVLQAERLRFERLAKDHGYYAFSGEHIFFRIDSAVGKRQVDILYGIRNYNKIDSSSQVVSVSHPTYRVNNVYIYPDFVPKDALEQGDSYLKNFDTTYYRGYYFISKNKKPELRYDVIIQSLYVKPGSVFNETNTEQTQSHLLGLKVYRLVNISYNDAIKPDNVDSRDLLINCDIQLTTLSLQSYQVELEGTNTVGNLGGALNLIYQHKNLFHGAELFSTKLKGAYEAFNGQGSKFRTTQEYGIETSLRTPKFLMPILNNSDFVKKYNPSTTISATYNYQDNPYYTRTIANATFGYTWKAGSYNEHTINPVQFNIVKLLRIDSAFMVNIVAPSYLSYSYKDVLILGGNYSYVFNNQKIKKSRDYWFLRINAEASGNILSLAERIVNAKKKDGSYNILDQPFAQYIKTDIDLRYNFTFNDVSSIVYRAFLGIGVPYGNSKAIPFEKQYFGGGANGIRAWQVRTLGPGSFNPGDNIGFKNMTSDIKLEANIEYRYKLFWIIEGAAFIDAGNIWSIRNDPAQPGSKFAFNKFYNDIAIGTGTGFRFDFKFVIGRLDFGMKLRDPSIAEGSKWIIMQRPYSIKKDFAMVMGIGYPF